MWWERGRLRPSPGPTWHLVPPRARATRGQQLPLVLAVVLSARALSQHQTSSHRAPKGTGSSTGTAQGCTHGLYLAHARPDVLRRLRGIIPSPAGANSLRQAVRAAGEGAALHSCRHSRWHRPWQPAEAVPKHGSSLSTLRGPGQDGPKRLSSAVCAHCHDKLQAHTKRGLSSTAKFCQISKPSFFSI